MLFRAHGKICPPQLLAGNFRELECRLLEFIVDQTIADMRRSLMGGEEPGSAFPQLRS